MDKTLDSIKQKMFALKLKEKRVVGGTTFFLLLFELPKDLPRTEEEKYQNLPRSKPKTDAPLLGGGS